MELKIFFDKVDEQLYANIHDESSFFHHLVVHNENFPNWENAKIVLVGLSEERGNLINEGAANAANAVRKSLYRLKKNAINAKIVDLGNVRNGITKEDTQQRIKELCEMFIENGCFVILLGGTHDLSYGQFLSYEKQDKLCSVVTVDAVIDLFAETTEVVAQNHLHHMLTHDPNYLFHFCHLGSQSFLNDVSVQDVLEKLHFEYIRLGQMRENFIEIEPIIRHADMMCFDIGAIKKADAPGNKLRNVFGLTAEEACQIAWYAGLSDKMSSVGIYEFNPIYDQDGQTAFVISTMIYYLVEGFNHRKGELDFNEKQFIRYMVSIGKDSNQIIVFYKSRLSEKWWMEVPYPIDKKTKYEKVSMIPCSYSDYEMALNGELPNRWVLMHGKLF